MDLKKTREGGSTIVQVKGGWLELRAWKERQGR
jgi:hypothetical protein